MLDQILTLNLILSTVVFAVGANIYVIPNLAKWSTQSVLIPLLLLQSFRHLGLMFLAKSATEPSIPPEFAYPAAIGDFVASLLAIASIFAIFRRAKFSKLLVWVFNIVGFADFVMAILLAIAYHATIHVGAAYWIPAFWVPGLLVSHWIIFLVLINHWELEDRA